MTSQSLHDVMSLQSSSFATMASQSLSDLMTSSQFDPRSVTSSTDDNVTATRIANPTSNSVYDVTTMTSSFGASPGSLICDANSPFGIAQRFVRDLNAKSAFSIENNLNSAEDVKNFLYDVVRSDEDCGAAMSAKADSFAENGKSPADGDSEVVLPLDLSLMTVDGGKVLRRSCEEDADKSSSNKVRNRSDS